MRIMPTIGTVWSNMQVRASPDWTSQISYDVVSSLPAAQPVWTAPMSFCTIATKYNEPLEAAYAHNADDRYDMGLCGAAGQPKLDLSDQLRRCSIPSTHAIRLSSANVLLCNRHQE